MKQSIFDRLVSYLRLHFLYLKISFKYLSVYRMSALLTFLFSLVFLVAEILTVDVYYKFSDKIGDWDKGSFYILLGTFNIVTCFYTFFFEIAHDDFVYKIRFGELDADLIRPMDALAYTSIKRVDYASLLNLPIPIWLVYQGIQQLGLRIILGDALLYVAFLFVSVFIVFLVNQFFVNFSFWITEVSNVTSASDQVVQLGSRPLQVYPKLVQLGFSYVVPIILCTNLSVSALQHDLHFYNILILLASLLLFFWVVRPQWKLGLKRYASAN